ncbi:hypothetical protein CEXT_720211 [Caerostris extrusa]|uniref:Uncharacterized protein n=1 Tax=Caerostris extrusa TaxID=172846 RepID=A0AAV4SZN4_CAEEX|nr:hypothetical protein CEXT_720211 [Caerostris extrusa]
MLQIKNIRISSKGLSFNYIISRFECFQNSRLPSMPKRTIHSLTKPFSSHRMAASHTLSCVRGPGTSRGVDPAAGSCQGSLDTLTPCAH